MSKNVIFDIYKCFSILVSGRFISLSAADSNNYSFLCLPLPLVINFAFGEKTKGKFNSRRWSAVLTPHPSNPIIRPMLLNSKTRFNLLLKSWFNWAINHLWTRNWFLKYTSPVLLWSSLITRLSVTQCMVGVCNI